MTDRLSIGFAVFLALIFLILITNKNEIIINSRNE
jgi:hypothetical protein